MINNYIKYVFYLNLRIWFLYLFVVIFVKWIVSNGVWIDFVKLWNYIYFCICYKLWLIYIMYMLIWEDINENIIVYLSF